MDVRRGLGLRRTRFGDGDIDLPRFGQISLAPFDYADLTRSKRRPVCVLSGERYNAGPDVLLAMVTSSRSKIERPGIGDVVVEDWEYAGLLRASTIRTGRLQTIERRLLTGPLGVLTPRDLDRVRTAVMDVLDLGTEGREEQ